MGEFRNFSGQPIISQILDVIPSSVINKANRKHRANRYYKRLPLRIHLVSLLYGVFSYCNGLREVCEGIWLAKGNWLIWDLTGLRLAARSRMPILKEVIRSLKRFIIVCLLNTIALSRTAG